MGTLIKSNFQGKAGIAQDSLQSEALFRYYRGVEIEEPSSYWRCVYGLRRLELLVVLEVEPFLSFRRVGGPFFGPILAYAS